MSRIDGIHFEVEGSAGAPAVLLLNSLGTDLALWDEQAVRWGRSFRVVRFDARGHGRSAAADPGGVMTIAGLARDALMVLDAAEISVAHWCGVSLGGMIAQWVAMHAPARVDRLALCNTTAHLPPAAFWQARMDLVRRDGMAELSVAIAERWFTPGFRASEPERVARVASMLRGADAESYAQACGAIRDMDQRAGLSRVTAPTLIVAGAHDVATPIEHSRALQAHIAGSRLEVLEAAHLSNVECAGEFCAVVGGFLLD